MSKPGTPSNLADIDVFRGIAALIVAAFHTREIAFIGLSEYCRQHGFLITPGSLAAYITVPLMWGYIGVPIFFVLSGYCIHRSQAFTRVNTGVFQMPASNFWVRRFLRIYPVLVGALLLTFFSDSLSRQYFPNSAKLGDTGIGAFLINLFSLQGIIGSTYGSNGPLWTLSLEVQFYAIYPLLLATMGRIGNLWSFLILIVVNTLSYFVLAPHGYLLFSSYYVTWYLGALVAEADAVGLFSKRLASRRSRVGLYSLSLGVLCAGCAVFFISQYAAFQVWAVAFSIFLLVILKRPAALPGRAAKLFRWLGTFSFSLYVVHQPIAVLTQSILFHSQKQASIASSYLALLVAVGIGYAFYFVFEKPALALSQKRKSKPRLRENQLAATA